MVVPYWKRVLAIRRNKKKTNIAMNLNKAVPDLNHVLASSRNKKTYKALIFSQKIFTTCYWLT